MKIFITLLLFVVALDSGWAQGSLTPPGVPAPTMRTLDQIEPRTPINTLPGDDSDRYIISQPGSYYLTTNVVVGSGTNGIRIAASDVAIDLNGYTLYGLANQIAIHSNPPGRGRVLIRNGQIVGWGQAINFYVSGLVTNVTVEDVQMNLAGGVSFATGVAAGDGLGMSRCSISGVSGSNANAVYAGDNCRLDACTVLNCYAGVVLGSFTTVKDCRIRQCPGGDGLSVGSTCIIRNNLVAACKNGLTIRNACEVSQNLCQDSSGNAFNISGNDNRVEDNQAVGNAFYGFITQGSTTNNFIVRNVARGSGSENFAINPADAAGPVVTASGTITNLNPWANFSF